MKETQTRRLLRFLREVPGSSSLEITLACQIVNVTGRVSDIRAGKGVPATEVECKRRWDGRDGYYVKERGQVELGL